VSAELLDNTGLSGCFSDSADDEAVFSDLGYTLVEFDGGTALVNLHE
jgi:hypothetical protein